LLTTPGLDSSLTETSYNFVDTARFQRRLPLPGRPTAALDFSNYARAIVGNPVRAACRRFGIDRIDVVGQTAGHPVDEPESILGKYDVVFAKARCALEAMATGCAVIVTDSAGLGGLVTRENVERLRRLNFGARAIQAAPLTEDTLLAQLKCYDPDDAAKVTDYIRAEADIQSAITRWEAVYAEVLDEWPRFRDGEGADFGRKQLAAAAEYLNFLGPIIKYRAEVDRSLQTLMVENTDLLAKLASAAAGGEPHTPPADA
jgi:hypothetical protein